MLQANGMVSKDAPAAETAEEETPAVEDNAPVAEVKEEKKPAAKKTAKAKKEE